MTVLFRGLAFPNGVALSKDNSFIVVAESGRSRILKFVLVNSEIHSPGEVFAELGRLPDNIKRNENGEFWVALNTGRGRIQRMGGEWFVNDPVGIKFSEDGKIVRVLDGNGGKILDSVSEVEEHYGRLWLGSAVQPYVGCMKN